LSSLQENAFIDLSDQLKALRSRLGSALTRELGPNAHMEGDVAKVRPRGIYPTSDGVEVHLIADGSMWLELKLTLVSELLHAVICLVKCRERGGVHDEVEADCWCCLYRLHRKSLSNGGTNYCNGRGGEFVPI